MGVNAFVKTSCLILLCLLLPACSSDAAEIEKARSAFSRFQGAILTGDRDALHKCLTRDSRKLVNTIALDQSSKKLLVTGGNLQRPNVILKIVDPNENHRASRFVVARENGEYRVDLIATAGFHQQ